MKRLLKNIYKFFDHLENSLRVSLSHHPIFSTFIGGVGIVLFWKGVWDLADHVPALHGLGSLVLGMAILLVTGLFVSFFVGDKGVITGLEKEERTVEKTEKELEIEMGETEELRAHIENIERSLLELKSIVQKR